MQNRIIGKMSSKDLQNCGPQNGVCRGGTKLTAARWGELGEGLLSTTVLHTAQLLAVGLVPQPESDPHVLTGTAEPVPRQDSGIESSDINTPSLILTYIHMHTCIKPQGTQSHEGVHISK